MPSPFFDSTPGWMSAAPTAPLFAPPSRTAPHHQPSSASYTPPVPPLANHRSTSDTSQAGAPPEPPGAPPAPDLHWQSQLVLLLVLPAAAVWAAILLLRLTSSGSLQAGGLGSPLVLAAASLASGALLAVLVWRARAATFAGACTGGLLMACFCLTTPGWRSSAWPLVAMLTLTLLATRIGRSRKQRLPNADPEHEQRHGRRASQVAANLGVSALSGVLINVHGAAIALTVLLAALSEAAADTLASELGVALGLTLGSTPRLITSWSPVPPGTDGGITLGGTALGAAGAIVVSAIGTIVLALPPSAGLIAALAGIAGLLFDSVLGATLERAGWLNNDAVNYLSTLFAAALALVFGDKLL